MSRLPDFLIVGGMRCGSTTLTNILKSQQGVFIPERKELHYFDQRNTEIQSIDDYRHQFIQAADSQLVGEATPDYLTSRGCAMRIHDDLPDVKLIMILRDPVRRAWSHYRFSVANCREIEPFDQALCLEAERLAHPIHEHDIFFSYQQRGRYIEHIQTYLTCFDPDQLHIVLLEELIASPQETLARLFSFLNLDHDSTWKHWLRITNQASLINLDSDSSTDTSKEQHFKFNRDSANWLNAPSVKFIPQSVRDSIYRKIESRLGHSELPDQKCQDQLQAYFEPFNHHLKAFLGRELPW